MTAKRECSKNVTTDNGWHWGPCSRPATVERDGDWWCWQHDPERVAGDKEGRLADWQAESAREVARYANLARNSRRAALVTEETAGILESLARIMDETGIAFGVPSVTDEIERACALAARIREALEEENDD